MKISGKKIGHILKIITAAVIVSCLFSCSSGQIKPLIINRNFTGSMWIVRNSISTPEKIDRLLDMIKDTNIKNLFVQVRGRGDAYYNSSIEPAGLDVKQDFDPLSYLIGRTKNTGIRIHAWVNISFVMNAKDYPGNPEHVLSIHPDWSTCDYTGRPMTDYSKKELENNLLEGYFLDPAIPEVKQYYCALIKDIISKYDIDGIHLDYIRYPFSGYSIIYKKLMSDFGYNPAARKAFRKKYGIDPVKIDREKRSKAKAVFDRFRTEQITEIVKDISALVKMKDKSIIVSAAVTPKIEIAAASYYQDWTLWLKKGYIDLACIMNYTDDTAIYMNNVEKVIKLADKEKLLMGIMINNKTGINTIIDEISCAYTSGIRGYILFSFDHNKECITRISDIIKYSRNDYIYY